jgi:hypothetical protein
MTIAEIISIIKAIREIIEIFRKKKETPKLKFLDPESRFAGMPIEVEYIDGIEWKLKGDVSYLTMVGETSTVKAGFVYDFASIPRWLFWLYPPAGDGSNCYGVAATFHDWLYAHRKIGGREITRKEADDLFKEIMLYIGVSEHIAALMYRAVRMFGWMPWGRRKPEDIIQYHKGEK